MEEIKRVSIFLKEIVRETYTEKGMRCFKGLIERYSEGDWEKEYLEGVYSYLEKRNSNSDTRVFSFDNFLIEDILNRVPLPSSP